MSRLITQLVAEEPALILVGKNTVLTQNVITSLPKKQVSVVFVEQNTIGLNTHLFQNSYKIVWVYEPQNDFNQEYVSVIELLKNYSVPVVVVCPLVSSFSFQGESNDSRIDFISWRNSLKKQTQFITDVNYSLSRVSFIFGNDIVGIQPEYSSLNFITQPFSFGKSYLPSGMLNPLLLQDYVTEVCQLIFIPNNQLSYLLCGQEIEAKKIIDLLKHVYETYYSRQLETLVLEIVVSPSIPFSLTEKIVLSDTNKIVSTLLPKVARPSNDYEQKRYEDNTLNKPSLPVKTLLDQQQTQPKTVDTLDTVSIKKFVIKKDLNFGIREPVVKQDATHEVFIKKEAVLEKTVTSQPIVLDKDPMLEIQESEIEVNDEIKRIFKVERTEKKVNRVANIVTKTDLLTKKSKHKKVLFVGGITSIIIASLILIFSSIYVVSSILLKKNLLNSVVNSSEIASNHFSENKLLQNLTKFVTFQTVLYSNFVENDFIATTSQLSSLSTDLQLIQGMLSEADEASKNLVLQVVTGNIGKTSMLAQILTDKVQVAYEKLSVIQATLEKTDFGTNTESQKQILSEYETKIQELRSGLSIHQQLQQILPSMTGEVEKRTYALLLQNNQELRPTGGFIQAVALLNFDSGSLVSTQVFSVYDLDKKIVGEIVPPKEITEFLGETHWFLRDSNWDPDFSHSSKQIAWFMNKSLGIDVDGVMAIDVNGLASLLEAIGPIDLPEHNEVITHKNIEERMEFHSEVVLVNSPESVDYSVRVLTETLKKMTQIDKKSVPLLLENLRNSFDTRQIQLAVFSDTDQSVLHSLGWTGDLVKPQCPTRLSVVDCSVAILAQVEANIGINKANYYINRTIEQKIDISRTSARHTRKISFENTAKSNSWPKGTYKSFQRYYIDSNATLESVSINGSPLLKEQIVVKQEENFQVVGVRVDVPIQKTLNLELIYSTPLEAQNSFSYAFFNHKQSGTGDDPLTVSITHTPDITPVLIAPNAVIDGQTITFTADSVNDASLFGVQFE